eukprot:Phypoly_transcript_17039.p1 GENE.Phypoly_transcript_17039~~Phypoly_transcript_17039.p1  ORF type:complete len:141 (+),score=24.54 Phypoly_transcript_17039:288-710(+)
MQAHAKNYIKFLKLTPHVEKGRFLVPTMGIDFMWHTHMSAPELYLPDTTRLAGKFLNHDTVSDSVLSDNFAYTAKLWERIYNEEYGDPRCGSVSNGSTCCAVSEKKKKNQSYRLIGPKKKIHEIHEKMGKKIKGKKKEEN